MLDSCLPLYMNIIIYCVYNSIKHECINACLSASYALYYILYITMPYLKLTLPNLQFISHSIAFHVHDVGSMNPSYLVFFSIIFSNIYHYFSN